MKTTTTIAILCIIILLGIATVLIFDISRPTPQYATIESYDECVKAGYPSLESYPAQCKTPDGRTFTQVVATSTAATTTPIETVTPSPTATSTTATSTPIKNVNVKANQTVSSPLTVKGTAPGNWYFEAVFGVKVVDSHGTTLGQAQAQAQGDWMTTNPVEFQAKITFTPSTTKTGSLVFMKDNPSGDPARDESYTIPITFAQ